jgi:methionine-rich copper-binding protein CopC
MTTHRTTTLAIAAAATLALAAPAFAHTEVESTSPAAGGKASTAITKVTVTFGEAIRTGTLKVYGPGGGKVSKGSGGRDPRKITRVRAGLKGSLAAGRYTVKWHATAADGHHQHGSFHFKLR